MLIITKIIIGLLIMLCILSMLSLCKVAGRSDQWEQELINDIKEKLYIM